MNTIYGRALAYEPALQAAVAVINALSALRRPSDRLCADCVWEDILKPIVTPLIGWERGYHPEPAADPRPGGELIEFLTMDGLPDPPRTPATTETERWMRSTEAWDGFTSALLERLSAIDPGNGHGIGRSAVKS
jgi:hypothetical protein